MRNELEGKGFFGRTCRAALIILMWIFVGTQLYRLQNLVHFITSLHINSLVVSILCSCSMKQYFNVNVKAHYTILDLIEIIFLAYLCMVSDDAICSRKHQDVSYSPDVFFFLIFYQIFWQFVLLLSCISVHTVCAVIEN